MSNLELTIRFLTLAAFGLFFTPAIRQFRLSPVASRRLYRAAILLYGAAMAVALGATMDWFLRPR
jgi:hypothetical protein